MTILVIDWGGKNKELVKKIESKGHEVILETEDGGRAYKVSGERLPQLILFTEGKISHSIQTAKSIRERKKTETIPFLFIESPEAKEKALKLGKIMNEEDFLHSI